MAVAGRFSSGYRYVGRIVIYEEGLVLAKMAGWADKGGFPVGSVISGGSLWIIIVIAVAAVGGGIAAFFTVKKRKKRTAGEG